MNQEKNDPRNGVYGIMSYLEMRLPSLIKSLEWTASQRRLTMKLGTEGESPVNYGWLPSGNVTDASYGTSAFSDCVNWMGFEELTKLLERIRHPRAREFRAESNDYRDAITRGIRMSTRSRLPVRLNDGAYIPYVPAYLDHGGMSATSGTQAWWTRLLNRSLNREFSTVPTAIMLAATSQPLLFLVSTVSLLPTWTDRLSPPSSIARGQDQPLL